MSQEPFEDRADRYDALIDWPRRLANEAPFYRRLFAEHRVRTVLDAACGTGRHAEMFHAWGLRVEGADVSAAMIDHCRARLGESQDLRWVQRSFDQSAEPPASFDAVICVGNSLPLADDPHTIDRAVHAMLASLKPGGICVIQVLNIWRLGEGPTIRQKVKRLTLQDEDHILIKCIHRSGPRAFVDIIDVKLENDGLESQFSEATFPGIEAGALAASAHQAGASAVHFFGNYQGDAYDRGRSPDLILVCTR